MSIIILGPGVVTPPLTPGGPGTPSGTYGQTLLNVANIIEHAYRRATGNPASQISAEEVAFARADLHMVLSNFANRGLDLWSVQKFGLNVVQYQSRYYLPDGAEGVLEFLLREGTFTDATALAAGSATLTYSAATRVQTVELSLPAVSGFVTWLVQGSADNATWETTGTFYGQLPVAATAVIDCDPQPEYLYWRALQSPAPVSTPTDARFVSAMRETNLGIVSRDSYFGLPDKGTSGRPTQFWYDKQVAPSVVVWPPPASTSYQFLLVLQMAVQDVGTMQNILGVPSRWLTAIISELALMLRMELPKERANPNIPLSDMRDIAERDLKSAANSETDGAPIMISPNIGCYTR